MKPFLRNAALVLALCSAALATSAGAQEGTGGTSSIFSLGVGARAIGMGGAFSAVGDDVSGLYYNPATLALNRYGAILASHAELFSGWSDSGFDFLGFVYPTISAGAFGAGFMTVGTGDIRGFDEWSRETGDLDYRESQAVVAYAYTLPWRRAGAISIGSSAKLLSQRVGEYSDTGAGLDVGFVYRPRWTRGVHLACNLQDIVGAEIKLVSVSEPVDRTILIGAGYTRELKNGSALAFAVQADLPARADSKVRAGAEYRYRDLLAVRAGYDGESVTAGVGIGWRLLGFDYAYMSREEAGSAHPMSLSVRIGSSIDERIRLREERRLAEEERRIQEILRKRIDGHIAAAERHRRDGSPAKALDELKIALDYDPTNRAVADTIAVVERAVLAAEEQRTKDAEQAALINRHFRLGLEYYSAGDYIRARTEWRSVLEIDPGNAQAAEYLGATEEKLDGLAAQHRGRAIDLERQGQLAAALGEWNMVRTIRPESEEARSAVARLNERVNELSRQYLTTATRLRVAELYEAAVKSFGDGRYPDAVSQIKELLSIDPKHAEARTLLLRAQRRLTPLDDAEKAEIRSLYIEGMKHFTDSDYLKAVERWQRILEIDPDNESVLRNIEEARKRLRDSGAGGER